MLVIVAPHIGPEHRETHTHIFYAYNI